MLLIKCLRAVLLLSCNWSSVLFGALSTLKLGARCIHCVGSAAAVQGAAPTNLILGYRSRSVLEMGVGGGGEGLVAYAVQQPFQFQFQFLLQERMQFSFSPACA